MVISLATFLLQKKMVRQINSTITRLGLQNTSWQFKYFTKNPEQNSIYIYQNTQLKKYFEEAMLRAGFFFHNLTVLKNEKKLKLLISYYTTSKFSKFIQWDQNKFYFVYVTKKLKHIIDCKKSIFLKKSLIKNIALRKSFLGHIVKSLSDFKNSNTNILLKFRQVNKDNNFYLSKNDLSHFKKNLLFLRRFYKKQFFKGIVNSILITIRLTSCASFFTNLVSKELLLIKKHTVLLFFIKQALNLFTKTSFSKIKGLKLFLKGKLTKSGRASQNKLSFGIVPTQILLSKLIYTQKTLFLKNGTISLKTWVNEKF